MACRTPASLLCGSLVRPSDLPTGGQFFSPLVAAKPPTGRAVGAWLRPGVSPPCRRSPARAVAVLPVAGRRTPPASATWSWCWETPRAWASSTLPSTWSYAASPCTTSSARRADRRDGAGLSPRRPGGDHRPCNGDRRPPFLLLRQPRPTAPAQKSRMCQGRAPIYALVRSSPRLGSPMRKAWATSWASSARGT